MEKKVKYKCLECDKTLYDFNSLKQHLKKSHPSRLFILHHQAPEKKALKHKCEKCNRQFSLVKHLKYHYRKDHGSIPPSLIVEKVIKNYQCDKCNSQYNELKNLRFHQRKIHGSESLSLPPKNSKRNLNCPLCNEKFENDDYILHFESIHDLTVKSESLQFSTLNDFNIWKENLENETKSKFICQRGSFINSINKKHYFVCHRSGNFISKSEGKRRIKSQGSKKINGFCPASLKVTENQDGLCNVDFVSTHVGHENELYHLIGFPRSDNSESGKKVNRIKRLKSSYPARVEVAKNQNGLYNIDFVSTQVGHGNELYHLNVCSGNNESGKLVKRIKMLKNFCPENFDNTNGDTEPCYSDSALGQTKELTHLTPSTSEQTIDSDKLKALDNNEASDHNELNTLDNEKTSNYNELKTLELSENESSLFLFEQKNLLRQQFDEIFMRINTINDLKVVQKQIDSIELPLCASSLNLSNKVEIGKNLALSKCSTSKRKFYSTKKKSENLIKKASTIEKEYITLQLLVKNL